VVTGLEALIRWRSPQRGLVPPIEFINLAEQMGLIGEIGDWVLREACRQAVNWPGEVTVAVNASPLQFETGHFASSVAAALAVSGLPASRLEIEITENLLFRIPASCSTRWPRCKKWAYDWCWTISAPALRASANWPDFASTK